MCYIKAPIADVDDLIMLDELREEAEAQLRLNHTIDTDITALPSEENADNIDDGFISALLSRFTQIHIPTYDLTNAFTQIQIEHVEAPVLEQSAIFHVIPYGISNAPESYLDIPVNYESVYDEINPQYFADANSFAEPPFLYQEL